MTDRREQPAVVEPLDPFACREFPGFEMPPRAPTADALGLVEPDTDSARALTPLYVKTVVAARQATSLRAVRERWSSMRAL